MRRLMNGMWRIVSRRKSSGDCEGVQLIFLTFRCGPGGFFDRQAESGKVCAEIDSSRSVETERGSGFVRHVISTRVLWFS